MARRLKHLQEAGETYFEHLRFAWSVGFVMLVHGLLPFVWEYKATEMMSRREIQRREYTRMNASGYE